MNHASSVGQSTPSAASDALLGRVERGLEEGLVPAEIFGDTAIFQAELERIFARSWVFLGLESEVPNSGDFVLRRIGKDSVIVTRDRSKTINVLANFCRHRGSQICHVDRGNASHFSCRYHGWVYKNTGEWTGAPDRSKAYPNIDAGAWSLLKAPHVDTFLGMIFASLDPNAPPLMDYLGGAAWMMKAIMDLHPDGMKVIGSPDRYRVRGNWKTAAENFAGDSYHVGVTHQSLQSIGLVPGLDGANAFISNYIFENGHGFTGSALDQMFGEAGHLWGYDSSIREKLDLSRLDEVQKDVVLHNPPVVGNIFPNLSFIRFTVAPSPGKPPIVYTSLRQWQPIGPGEMEVWSWQLKWDFMNEEQVASSYAAGQYGFSSAGIFEQDDTAVWEGSPVTAQTVWARKAGAMYNMQLGMKELGGAQKRDLAWTGPGEVYRPGPGEAPARAFYSHWLREMQRSR